MKKIVSALLVLLTVVGLVGCSEKIEYTEDGYEIAKYEKFASPDTENLKNSKIYIEGIFDTIDSTDYEDMVAYSCTISSTDGDWYHPIIVEGVESMEGKQLNKELAESLVGQEVKIYGEFDSFMESEQKPQINIFDSGTRIVDNDGNSYSMMDFIEDKPVKNDIYANSVDFGDNNSVIFGVVEEDGIIKTSFSINFDGENPDREAALFFTSFLFVNLNECENYILMAMSGEAKDDLSTTGVIVSIDGQTQTLSPLPETYRTAIGDNPYALILKYSEDCIKLIDDLGDYEDMKNFKDTFLQAVEIYSKESIETQQPSKTFIHEDEYVEIHFIGCDTDTYKGEIMIFEVSNKTDIELTFQSNSFALDGISLGYISGSDTVAAQSTGKIRYSAKEDFPTMTPELITGNIRVVDFSDTLFKRSHEVNFVNIEIEYE